MRNSSVHVTRGPVTYNSRKEDLILLDLLYIKIYYLLVSLHTLFIVAQFVLEIVVLDENESIKKLIDYTTIFNWHLLNVAKSTQ